MTESMPFIDVANDAEKIQDLRMHYMSLKTTLEALTLHIQIKTMKREDVLQEWIDVETVNQEIIEVRNRMKAACEYIAQAARKFMTKVNFGNWMRFLNFQPDVAREIIQSLGVDIAADIEGLLKLQRNFLELRDQKDNVEFDLEEAKANGEDATDLQDEKDKLDEAYEYAKTELESATAWVYDLLRKEKKYSESTERTQMIQAIQNTLKGRKRNWPPPPEIRAFKDPETPEPKQPASEKPSSSPQVDEACAYPKPKYDEGVFKRPLTPKGPRGSRPQPPSLTDSLADLHNTLAEDFSAHLDEMKQTAGPNASGSGQVLICGTELSNNEMDLLAIPEKLEGANQHNFVSSENHKQYLTAGNMPSMGIASQQIRDNMEKIDERLIKQMVRETFLFCFWNCLQFSKSLEWSRSLAKL